MPHRVDSTCPQNSPNPAKRLSTRVPSWMLSSRWATSEPPPTSLLPEGSLALGLDACCPWSWCGAGAATEPLDVTGGGAVGAGAAACGAASAPVAERGWHVKMRDERSDAIVAVSMPCQQPWDGRGGSGGRRQRRAAGGGSGGGDDGRQARRSSGVNSRRAVAVADSFLAKRGGGAYPSC